MPQDRIAYPAPVRRLTSPRILARRAGTARYAAMVVFGVLVAHDVVYTAQEAMGSTNAAVAEVTHRYWPSFVALAMLATAVLVSWAATGLIRLRLALQRLPAPPPAATRTERTYFAELAQWLRTHQRSSFLLTAPPLRLPGAVGSPATPVATV